MQMMLILMAKKPVIFYYDEKTVLIEPKKIEVNIKYSEPVTFHLIDNEKIILP